MKLFFLITPLLSTAQKDNLNNGYHRHDGFYLSLNFGPQVGDILIKTNGRNDIGLNGVGLMGDYKIGGAIKENLILHFTFLGNSIENPAIEGIITNNTLGSIPAAAPVGISYAGIGMLIGGGITQYIMPQNIFLSASVGTGQFSILHMIGTFSTNVGTSFQLKAGKEWWVSANWGLGLSLSYIRTNANMQYGNSSTERWASDFFGLMFNTTFN